MTITATSLLLCAALLLSACDSSQTTPAPKPEPAQAAPAAAPSAPADAPDAAAQGASTPEAPRTAATLFEEAQCRHLASAYEPALDHIDQALELEPDHPEALLLKARILTALGRPDEAFATLDALAASRHPDAATFQARIATDADLAALRDDPRMGAFTD